MSENASHNPLSHRQGSTFEHMVETFSGKFGVFDARPADRARTFDWNTEFWSDGTLSLFTGQYHSDWSVRVAPETQACLSILLPRTGTLDVSLGRAVIEGIPGRMLLVMNHEAERVSVRGAPHHSDFLCLDWAVFAQKVTAILDIPLTRTLELAPVMDLSSSSGQVIASLIQTLFVGMRSEGLLLRSPIAMSNLTETLADMIVRSVPHRLSHLLDKKIYSIAPRHVRNAIEFMHVNIGRPFTMQMVAEAVGVSLRTLEEGFRTFKATTPASFLRTIRVRAVREDLLDPSNEQSVGEICMKWGFFHFGRFSAVYRKTYGENPSDTRKRAANRNVRCKGG